ncbi:MAG: phosphate butyryltransferase [Bacteroidetes bacterium GWF2_41_61]|jgi:phosphate butyryltransferase|nr:MAG: phosphate butyryltransferase [Bacteroidetes bacterium GWE2_40_15]OFY31467.1 MAG: phosphate butyryltransferase [Bacteroidetes bacterium GWF2_41_61]PKP05475.1 MAG: phosphate butyryltransferase [Bacteroidetes bacterium HGW-Bacteroidetes-5]HBG24817.1 phosphate butyryltransferase [Rikenellaceae bacterium]HBZ25074.1 phosphate butyryltransferase [Rikenellaceae bacterium]
MITTFEQIFETLRSKPKKRLVAAWAVDDHTINAARLAIEAGIVEATLVGDEKLIRQVCDHEKIDPSIFKIVDIDDEIKAVSAAVDIINAGEGDILMKGLCSTDKYMRAILNKERGLLPAKAVLSHVTVLSNPQYHKLLIMGDIAVIPAPDLTQKIAITNYVVKTAHAIGIAKPKVALIAATEQMMPGMPACVDAAIISKMADRGQISGCLVDGPLALDVALSAEAVAVKKLVSSVAGDADCLVFPNIESANVFYKVNTQLCIGAKQAAIVAGAKAPCVLSSRADSIDTKLNSIALAALTAK